MGGHGIYAIITAMSEEKGKVITSFRQRRSLELALQDLRNVSDHDELESRARALAESDAPVLQALLRSLRTSDPRLIGGLGTVSLYLDEGEIVPALRRVATDPLRTDEERMSAILILDRFLGEKIDRHLIENLRNPNAIARESLRQVMMEAQEDRSIWLEYLEQLEEQADDVAFMVMDMMLELEEDGCVEPLRLLAQEPRLSIAQEALRLLGTLRLPDAVVALETLIPNIPPTLHPLAERNLRKLRFSGVKVEASSWQEADWRILATPVDGEGGQALWMLTEQPEGDDTRFLGILISEDEGLKQAFGGDRVPVEQTRLHSVQDAESPFVVMAGGEGHYLLFQEVPLSYAQAIVAGALERNFAFDHPVPSYYRLLNPYLWSLHSKNPADRGSSSLGEEPTRDDDVEVLLPQTPELLDHPAFAGWIIQTPDIFKLAARALLGTESDHAQAVNALLASLDEEDECTRYRDRLERMREWLVFTGDEPILRLAQVLVISLESTPPVQHPFFRRMAERGLQAAQDHLRDNLEQQINS